GGGGGGGGGGGWGGGGRGGGAGGGGGGPPRRAAGGGDARRGGREPLRHARAEAHDARQRQVGLEHRQHEIIEVHRVEVHGRIRVVARERLEHRTDVAAPRVERDRQPLLGIGQQGQSAHERHALARVAAATPAKDQRLNLAGPADAREQQRRPAHDVVDAPCFERPVHADTREDRPLLGVDHDPPAAAPPA